MLFHHASKNRPFHLGTYPLEVLPRDEAVIDAEAARLPARPSAAAEAGGALGPAVLRYRELFARFAEGGAAAEPAPVPARLDRRAQDIKGCSYFMDADQVGICRIPDSTWLEGRPPLEGHSHAVVVLVALPPIPDRDNLARAWVEDAVAATAEMRVLEIAACTAGHIRQMGFEARIHHAGDEGLDRERLAVLAGLCLRSGDRLTNPYIAGEFRARRHLHRLRTGMRQPARLRRRRCAQPGLPQGRCRRRLRPRTRAPGAAEIPPEPLPDGAGPPGGPAHHAHHRRRGAARAAAGRVLHPGGQGRPRREIAARARPLRLQASALLQPAPAHPRHGAPPGRRGGRRVGGRPLWRPGRECARRQGALLFPRLGPDGHLRDSALCLVLAPGGRQHLSRCTTATPSSC